MMNVAALKDALSALGLSSSTPGVRGEERRAILIARYESAKGKEPKSSMSMTDLRRELEKAGVNTSTPGLRGEARMEVLLTRWHQLKDNVPVDAGNEPQAQVESPIKKSINKKMQAQALKDEIVRIRDTRERAIAQQLAQLSEPVDGLTAKLQQLQRNRNALFLKDGKCENDLEAKEMVLQQSITAAMRKETLIRERELNHPEHGVAVEQSKVQSLKRLETEIDAHLHMGFEEIVQLEPRPASRVNPLLGSTTSLSQMRRQTLPVLSRTQSERSLPESPKRERIKTFGAPPTSHLSKADNLGRKAYFFHRIKGDFDAAEVAYNEAIDLEPTHGVNLGHFALFLDLVRGRPDDAEELYLRAIDATTEDATHLSNYASFLRRVRDDKDRAEDYYRRGLREFPHDCNNLGNYANFLRSKGDFKQARVYFEKALALKPEHCNNIAQYASLLTELGSLQEASALYEKAIQLEPRNANLYGNYANTLRKDHQIEKAKEMYLKGMKLDRDNPIIAQNYALLLRDFPAIRTGETKRIHCHPRDLFKQVGSDVNLMCRTTNAFRLAKT